MIELCTLGSLTLRAPNGEDLHPVLAQPKRIALLAYLAIARPHGFHRRDSLLALFWPEQDARHARWALNQALRHLRTALGKEAVPSRGDGEIGIDVRLVSCDAQRFEAAIESGDLAQALELYRGDLLEGFHVSGCGEFERWLEEERVWLRRRAAQAAAALAHREEARREPAAAGHWARRAFALAPDDEGEIRRLIELLGRLGDRAGAVQTYEEFARRLRIEYEVEPSPETRAAIAAVKAREVVTPLAPTVVADQPGVNVGPALPEPAAEVPLSRPRPRNRRPVLLALGLLALVAVGAMSRAWQPEPPVLGRATVSPTTIAVLPFAYQGTEEFAYLGEGMMDLLSANLDGAGDIRAVDPNAVLALVRQAGSDRLEPEQARELAARLGAGSYVLGTVVETGGRIRISARLHSADRNGGGRQAVADGVSRELFQLVDRLTATLIAQQSGGPAGALPRLAAVTTDSLAALKAYLAAERHFRAWFPDSTAQAARRAVRIDSTFALAHYRLATALSGHDGRAAAAAVDRALRHGHRLSERDRRLIQAFAAFAHGRVIEAERIYRAIVTRNPDDLEAIYQLVNLIARWSGVVGGSWLDARAPFERVLTIDPTRIEALFHLSWIAAREGRLEQLDSLTDRLLTDRRLPVLLPEEALFLRGQHAIAFGDALETARFIATLRQTNDEAAQFAGGVAVFSTGDLVVGRRVWRVFTAPTRSRGLRVLAHLTLAKMELMTGRWSAAKVELDSAAALDPVTALEHRALLSLWPLLRVPRAELLALREAVRRRQAADGPGDEGFVTGEHAPAHPYLRLYLLGLLSARLGEHATALEHAAELERLAGSSFAPAFVHGLGRTVRVEVARARGHMDQALATLDSAGFWASWEVKVTGNSPFYFHEYEQLLRAELLDELGRDDEAIQAYRGIADYLFHSGAPAHLRLAELYERRGEPRKAAAHWARFAKLWKDCDPELRSLVIEARRRLRHDTGLSTERPSARDPAAHSRLADRKPAPS